MPYKLPELLWQLKIKKIVQLFIAQLVTEPRNKGSLEAIAETHRNNLPVLFSFITIT